MLSVVALVGIAALSHRDAQTSQIQPPTPDFRYEFPIRPRTSSTSLKWRCGGSVADSAVTIETTNFLDRQGRVQFKSRLTQLIIRGDTPVKEILNQTAKNVGTISQLQSVNSECRGRTEYLRIKGWSYDGVRDNARDYTFTFE